MRLNVGIKRALVIGGLVILAIGLIVNVAFVKGLGIGIAIIGFVAAGGA